MEQKKNISLLGMVLLNVINFGLVGFWSFDGAIMPLFLTSKFNMSNTQIVFIVGIGKIMIALSLVFGLYSDITRTKMGKRRPLMLIGGLIAAPLIALIPYIPSIPVLIAVITLVYFGIQFAAVPYFALVPEVVPNEKLGTANAFFSAFGGIGTLVAYAVLLMVVYSTNKPLAFQIMAMIVLFGTIVSVACTKESIPETTGPKQSKLKQIKDFTVSIFKQLPELPELMWFLFSNLFFWLALGAFLIFFTKFFEYYVNIPGTKGGLILGIVIIVSVLLAVPVGMLGDKISRKGFLYVGMAIIFVGLSIGYFTIGPTSKAAGYDISSEKQVKQLASAYGYNIDSIDLSGFSKDPFDPPVDVNQDEMFDKKVDVMRWCLNGELEPEQCENAVPLVMGTDHPDLAKVQENFKAIQGEMATDSKKVLILAFAVIIFTAVGLTICFIIMATILPTLMPEDKMGLYMGFYSTVTGIGQFLSVLIAGFVIDLTLAKNIGAVGYRWIFIQGSVFMLFAIVMLYIVPYIPNATDPTITDKLNRKEK
ncbi:MAG TPA: MFS transporter [bacterium]|nr:MFS transporter [bacterium]